MSKLHDLWNNAIRPKRGGVVPSNPNPPPMPKTKNQSPKTKRQRPSHKCVEFTALTVDGVGDRLAGVVLDTILAPKFKNPKIYVVLVCRINNQYRYQQSYIKYINACYCIPSKLNIEKIPKHKLEYNRENNKGA